MLLTVEGLRCKLKTFDCVIINHGRNIVNTEAEEGGPRDRDHEEDGTESVYWRLISPYSRA